MSDLHDKLTTLQAQLAAARAELEAAKTKAAESTDLHEKLNHLTRARAAQDLVSSIEGEISAVRSAIAEEQRLEHRQELLERVRGIAAEVREHRGELQSLIQDVAEAVAALQRRAPGIISRWRGARERWMSVFAQLEPGLWPHHGGDVENSRRLERLEAVLAELGGDARALLQLPPGLRPTNRLESTTFESRNWHASPPQAPKDYALFALDALLNRPLTQQPASVAAPDSSRSL